MRAKLDESMANELLMPALPLVVDHGTAIVMR
jgi:hypothetical protein